MKTLILILLVVPSMLQNEGTPFKPKQRDVASEVRGLAEANGFKPSMRVVSAIVQASKQYGLDAKDLTAIGIIETGLGTNAKTRKNSNGTHDKGLFQINTVNANTCIEYNLESPEGSALCAAKLLAGHKAKRADYMGVYHSKTPSKKAIYLKKVAKVFQNEADKQNVTQNEN